MEGEGDEDFDWVKVEGRNYLIKYPKPKNHSEEDYRLKAAYIKNYLTDHDGSPHLVMALMKSILMSGSLLNILSYKKYLKMSISTYQAYLLIKMK